MGEGNPMKTTASMKRMLIEPLYDLESLNQMRALKTEGAKMRRMAAV